MTQLGRLQIWGAGSNSLPAPRSILPLAGAQLEDLPTSDTLKHPDGAGHLQTDSARFVAVRTDHGQPISRVNVQGVYLITVIRWGGGLVTHTNPA